LLAFGGLGSLNDLVRAVNTVQRHPGTNMSQSLENDVEKGISLEKGPDVSSAHESGDVVTPTYLQAEEFDRSTVFGKFMYASRRLETKLGIEAVSASGREKFLYRLVITI
jgi:hypothetical protein